ncbi:MAG: OmpA family protein [Myxococcota bacterium]
MHAWAQDTPVIPAPPPEAVENTEQSDTDATGDAAIETSAEEEAESADARDERPPAVDPAVEPSVTGRASSADAPPAAETSQTAAKTDVASPPLASRSAARTAVSLSGATGVLRVSAADALPVGLIRIGFGLDFFKVGSFFEPDDNHGRIGATLSLSAAPIDYMEAWLNVRATSNSNDFTEPSLLQSQGDVALGVKGFYPINRMLAAGADLQLTFLSGIGNSTFDFGATEVRLRGLFTADFTQSTDIPLRVHANLGYVFDNSEALLDNGEQLTQPERFALSIYEFSRITFGVAVEAPLKYVTPYIEYNAEFPVSPQYLATPGVIAVGRGLTVAQATPPPVVDTPARPAYQRIVPQVITPGIRVTAIPKLTLDLAIEIGITPEETVGVPSVPPYNVILFASYPLDPFGVQSTDVSGPPISVPVVIPEEIPAADGRGRLAGLVTDKDTQQPLGDAIVRFDRAPPVATASSGRFRSLEIEPGPLQVTVAKDGYESSTGTVEIAAEDELEIAVELQRTAEEGTIRLRITDDQDQPLANATVVFDGPTQRSAQTAEDGGFEFKGTQGAYSLSVEKEGYLAKAKSFELNAGETISADVLLRARPQQELVEVKGDRIILRGKVHFITAEARLDPDAATLLDNLVDFLVRNAALKVRIEGHTDNVGSDAANLKLSRERAEAVKKYLTDNGIDSERLATEGFGPSRPLAPNLTRRGREQNRRVEFHLEQ